MRNGLAISFYRIKLPLLKQTLLRAITLIILLTFLCQNLACLPAEQASLPEKAGAYPAHTLKPPGLDDPELRDEVYGMMVEVYEERDAAHQKPIDDLIYRYTVEEHRDTALPGLPEFQGWLHTAMRKSGATDAFQGLIDALPKGERIIQIIELDSVDQLPKYRQPGEAKEEPVWGHSSSDWVSIFVIKGELQEAETNVEKRNEIISRFFYEAGARATLGERMAKEAFAKVSQISRRQAMAISVGVQRDVEKINNSIAKAVAQHGCLPENHKHSRLFKTLDFAKAGDFSNIGRDHTLRWDLRNYMLRCAKDAMRREELTYVVEHTEGTLDILLEFLVNSDTQVHLSAQSSIAALAKKRFMPAKLASALPYLATDLTDGNPAVRLGAEMALTACARSKITPRGLEAIIPDLFACLAHADRDVRVRTSRVITAIAQQEIAVTLIMQRLQSTIHAGYILGATADEKLDEDRQRIGALAMSLCPMPEILAKMGWDPYELAIDSEDFEAANRIFKRLDLTGVSLGAQECIKNWILGRRTSNPKESETAILNAARYILLPTLRIMEYLEQDLPPIDLSIDNGFGDKEDVFKAALLLNYLALIGTYSLAARSGVCFPERGVNRFTKEALASTLTPLMLLLDPGPGAYLPPQNFLSSLSGDSEAQCHISLPADIGRAAVPIFMASLLGSEIPKAGGIFGALVRDLTEREGENPGFPDLWRCKNMIPDSITGEEDYSDKISLRDIPGTEDKRLRRSFRIKTFLTICHYAAREPDKLRMSKRKKQSLAEKHEEFLNLISSFYSALGFGGADIDTFNGKDLPPGTSISEMRDYAGDVARRVMAKIIADAKAAVGEPQELETDMTYAWRAVNTYLSQEVGVKFARRLARLISEIEDIYYSDCPQPISRELRRIHKEGEFHLPGSDLVRKLREIISDDHAYSETERARAVELLGIGVAGVDAHPGAIAALEGASESPSGAVRDAARRALAIHRYRVHEAIIDRFILEHIDNIQPISRNIRQALIEGLTNSGIENPEALLGRLDSMGVQMQLLVVEDDEKLPEFEGKEVRAHPSDKFITVFVRRGELENIQRGELENIRLILSKLFHDIRARGHRPGQALAEFEEINVRIEEEVRLNGRITSPELVHAFVESTREPPEHLEMEDRDYTAADESAEGPASSDAEVHSAIDTLVSEWFDRPALPLPKYDLGVREVYFERFIQQHFPAAEFDFARSSQPEGSFYKFHNTYCTDRESARRALRRLWAIYQTYAPLCREANRRVRALLHRDDVGFTHIEFWAQGPGIGFNNVPSEQAGVGALAVNFDDFAQEADDVWGIGDVAHELGHCLSGLIKSGYPGAPEQANEMQANWVVSQVVSRDEARAFVRNRIDFTLRRLRGRETILPSTAGVLAAFAALFGIVEEFPEIAPYIGSGMVSQYTEFCRRLSLVMPSSHGTQDQNLVKGDVPDGDIRAEQRRLVNEGWAVAWNMKNADKILQILERGGGGLADTECDQLIGLLFTKKVWVFAKTTVPPGVRAQLRANLSSLERRKKLADAIGRQGDAVSDILRNSRMYRDYFKREYRVRAGRAIEGHKETQTPALTERTFVTCFSEEGYFATTQALGHGSKEENTVAMHCNGVIGLEQTGKEQARKEQARKEQAGKEQTGVEQARLEQTGLALVMLHEHMDAIRGRHEEDILDEPRNNIFDQHIRKPWTGMLVAHGVEEAAGPATAVKLGPERKITLEASAEGRAVVEMLVKSIQERVPALNAEVNQAIRAEVAKVSTAARPLGPYKVPTRLWERYKDIFREVCATDIAKDVPALTPLRTRLATGEFLDAESLGPLIRLFLESNKLLVFSSQTLTIRGRRIKNIPLLSLHETEEPRLHPVEVMGERVDMLVVYTKEQTLSNCMRVSLAGATFTSVNIRGMAPVVIFKEGVDDELGDYYDTLAYIYDPKNNGQLPPKMRTDDSNYNEAVKALICRQWSLAEFREFRSREEFIKKHRSPFVEGVLKHEAAHRAIDPYVPRDLAEAFTFLFDIANAPYRWVRLHEILKKLSPGALKSGKHETGAAALFMVILPEIVRNKGVDNLPGVSDDEYRAATQGDLVQRMEGTLKIVHRLPEDVAVDECARLFAGIRGRGPVATRAQASSLASLLSRQSILATLNQVGPPLTPQVLNQLLDVELPNVLRQWRPGQDISQVIDALRSDRFGKLTPDQIRILVKYFVAERRLGRGPTGHGAIRRDISDEEIEAHIKERGEDIPTGPTNMDPLIQQGRDRIGNAWNDNEHRVRALISILAGEDGLNMSHLLQDITTGILKAVDDLSGVDKTKRGLKQFPAMVRIKDGQLQWALGHCTEDYAAYSQEVLDRIRNHPNEKLRPILMSEYLFHEPLCYHLQRIKGLTYEQAHQTARLIQIIMYQNRAVTDEEIKAALSQQPGRDALSFELTRILRGVIEDCIQVASTKPLTITYWGRARRAQKNVGPGLQRWPVTHLNRWPIQMELLSSVILPILISSKKDKITLLCVASATGEEQATITAVAQEACDRLRIETNLSSESGGLQLRVLGVELHEVCIQEAKRRLFTGESPLWIDEEGHGRIERATEIVGLLNRHQARLPLVIGFYNNDAADASIRHLFQEADVIFLNAIDVLPPATFARISENLAACNGWIITTERDFALAGNSTPCMLDDEETTFYVQRPKDMVGSPWPTVWEALRKETVTAIEKSTSAWAVDYPVNFLWHLIERLLPVWEMPEKDAMPHPYENINAYVDVLNHARQLIEEGRVHLPASSISALRIAQDSPGVPKPIQEMAGRILKAVPAEELAWVDGVRTSAKKPSTEPSVSTDSGQAGSEAEESAKVEGAMLAPLETEEEIRQYIHATIATAEKFYAEERLIEQRTAKPNRYIIMTKTTMNPKQWTTAGGRLDNFLGERRATELVLVDNIEALNKKLDELGCDRKNAVLVATPGELNSLDQKHKDEKFRAVAVSAEEGQPVPLVGIASYADTLLDLTPDLVPILREQFINIVGGQTRIDSNPQLQTMLQSFDVANPDRFVQQLDKDPIGFAQRIHLLLPTMKPRKFDILNIFKQREKEFFDKWA